MQTVILLALLNARHKTRLITPVCPEFAYFSGVKDLITIFRPNELTCTLTHTESDEDDEIVRVAREEPKVQAIREIVESIRKVNVLDN